MKNKIEKILIEILKRNSILKYSIIFIVNWEEKIKLKEKTKIIKETKKIEELGGTSWIQGMLQAKIKMAPGPTRVSPISIFFCAWSKIYQKFDGGPKDFSVHPYPWTWFSFFLFNIIYLILVILVINLN